MLPGAPAIRFAQKLTKKQTRFLQDAIMPDCEDSERWFICG
jgi:hypothetical protein